MNLLLRTVVVKSYDKMTRGINRHNYDSTTQLSFDYNRSGVGKPQRNANLTRFDFAVNYSRLEKFFFDSNLFLCKQVTCSAHEVGRATLYDATTI